MNFFISQAHAQGGPPPAPGMDLFQIGFLILLFAMFYFLAIRPQRKRQKEHADMVGSLSKGDEVTTNGGILGRVVKVEDDLLILEVADGVELKLQKVAVHAVLPKGTLDRI